VPDDAPPLPPDDVLRAGQRDAAVIDIATRHGRAVAHVHAAHGRDAGSPVGVLVLGHGAGGGVAAPDLVAVAASAAAAGWSVVLVEQPYRAAGKRVPPRAPVLDEAWCDVVHELRDTRMAGLADGLPLVVGGRSAGARVACRTALPTGAAGVVALAFPTRPGRADRPSRVPELDAAGVPVLVVQGSADPYGAPPTGPGREVAVVPGDHGLRKDLPAVADAVTRWLGRLAD